MSDLAGEIAADVAKRLERSKTPIPIGVSNRHCHLTEEHFKILFGAQARPNRIKDIKQPGFWAAEEVIAVKGPRGRLERVRLVGPYRSRTQIELAMTDAKAIGVKPPVRESGDVKGSAGAELIGPAGRLTLAEGVIVALRHVHFAPKEAAALGIKAGEMLRLRCGTGGGRSSVFEDCVARVSDQYSLELHLDTDEAYAAGVKTGDLAYIV
ncbi:MAG: phosphate propanoyltransferase [Elusimicrobia bacterium]|nr:phosphate propanoyltransferase [Elusimicrobiota bacterium]MDE2238116.1 phosphate propanoyltransferase [Elusimicrobiota bacterium]MDE2426483.1 phosphate propanoyltransferase [Elusimicrobiota bacterium]